ncbi:MAG: DUF1465 family protein [Proteobacteria bacterium]|nr:DUF1465 family protein [Pseudomonadota bacterium]
MVPHLPDGPTVGLANSYQATFALLAEARDYAAIGVAADSGALEPFDRLRLNNTAMQLTACLASIAAWLLSQRAVEAGEITREQGHGRQHRLAPCPLCDDAAAKTGPLPERLEILIERTLVLYRRVERLDRLLDADGASRQPGGEPRPAL